MARPISNVVIATDSFATWVGVTNQMADTFTRYALTANNSTTGANVSGNAQLWGIFGSNTVAVATSLRGGTVDATANLLITSNAVFSGPTIAAGSNVSVTATYAYFDVDVFRVIGGLANVASNIQHNAAFLQLNTGIVNVNGGYITVTSNTSLLASNVYVNSAIVRITGGLANVTSNVSIDTTNVAVNATNLYVSGGQANITSNVAVVNSNTHVNSAVTYVAGGLANVTSNVSVVTTNTYVNSAVTYIAGGLANVTSNVSVVTANVYTNATTTYIVGGTANVTSNVTITNANTNINATAFGVQSVTTVTGNTTFKANSSLTNIALTSNATISNLAISADQTTIAGNVAFDTSTLFVDAANNRVGIVNTTPDAALTVTGSANVSGTVRIGTNLNTVGTLTVNGAVTINNTVASGNTTVTGFINTSTYGTFGGTVNAASLNIGANVNVTNTQINIGNATINTVYSAVGLVAGNTTSNLVANSTAIVIGNTTVNTSISPTAILTGATLGVGNTTVTGTLSASGNTTLTGNTTMGSEVVLATVVNTNIGFANTTGTFSVVNLFSFPVGTYTGAKITAKITSLSGANTQIQELILAQNTTDVNITVYGTVASPATANLGVFSGLINSTAVAVGFQQSSANSNVKLFAQLIK